MGVKIGCDCSERDAEFRNRLEEDGAAFVALTNAIVEVANGFYKVNLAAVDLNGDVIGLKFTAPTANQTALVFLTT